MKNSMKKAAQKLISIDITAFIAFSISIIAGLGLIFGILGLYKKFSLDLSIIDGVVSPLSGLLGFYALRHPHAKSPKWIITAVTTAACMLGLSFASSESSAVMFLTMPFLVCILTTGKLQVVLLYPPFLLLALATSRVMRGFISPLLVGFDLLLFLTLWVVQTRATIAAAERAQAEARLKQEQEARNFVRSCEHELRNYARGFEGLLPLIKQECSAITGGASAERLDQVLLATEDIVDRLATLTKKMLITTREGVLPTTQKQLFEVDALLGGIVASEKAFIAHQGLGVEISVDVQPNLMIYGDSEYIAMAFGTAIRNATEIVGNIRKLNRRLVSISAWSTKQDVVVSIKDSGCGYPSELLAKLREVSHSDGNILIGASSKTGGSGLGLPLIVRVARLHNGFVYFDNIPESGACIEFHFPNV